MSDNNALMANSYLYRRHYVLSGNGYQLLALGVEDLNLSNLRETKTEQKLLDYAGIRKLSKVEVRNYLQFFL